MVTCIPSKHLHPSQLLWLPTYPSQALWFTCPKYQLYLCSVLGCVLPLQEVALRKSPPTLSFPLLVHIAPCCPTLSFLQCFGLQTDLTPFICHSVLLTVHLLSFILAMCPAHFHFVLVMYQLYLSQQLW